MSDDARKPPDRGDDDQGVVLSRRKLVYAAPMVVTAHLFNSLAGCGKSSPTVRQCRVIARLS